MPAVAASGKTALQKAGENVIDIAIIDIRLRGRMDGIEAATRLRACTSRNPKLVIV